MPHPPAPVSDNSRVVRQEVPHLDELWAAADKVAELHGQVVRQDVQGAQRSEPTRKISMGHLPDTFRSPEVTQSVQPEIDQRNTVPQTVGDEIRGRQPIRRPGRRGQWPEAGRSG